LTADAIHQIGVREVKRIRSQMEEIIREISYDGDFAQFLEFLRTDKQFYFSNSNDLIAAYRQFCRRVDPLLPRLFHRLPRVSYTIQPIPAQLAPDTTTAYYRPPSADGRRAGTYFVNLYRPEVRPKYEIAALSLHESVPGHHLQLALAMEREDVPAFRRYTGYTAFVEGWALYAEKLGEELEVYNTPYQRFGQLTYEMWRAVRLVVDTGIHSKQWTRQRAIDFFAANTAKTQHDIENEIDRYIAWPGQALAYKIGELKIRQLRQIAESQLEDRFDIRDFHDVILKNGALPLDVLEQRVQRWLEMQKDR
jgi:prolyl oligopeptidase